MTEINETVPDGNTVPAITDEATIVDFPTPQQPSKRKMTADEAGAAIVQLPENGNNGTFAENAPSEIDVANARIAELEKEISDGNEIINDLTSKLNSMQKQAANGGKPVIELDGKNYEFTIPKFQWNGVVHIAEELKHDFDKVREFIGLGIGGIKEV